MITVQQIGWSRYSTYEGPFFGGDFKVLKVPAAEREDSFARKVLAVTAAAEGGSWSSVNMYDAGLVSVGAMQFIDVAPRHGVVDMLGEVADSCGVDAVVSALKPALSMSNATFQKTSTGKWRFFLNGKVVDSRALQHELYFGDASGNKQGSFTEAKKLRAKTWAACMANVWYIQGAVDVQSAYCLRRLMTDFTWGTLRAELFNKNEDVDGWVGATKAMLLAYAVNAPAIVVKMYDSGRVNGKEKFSPDWCLELLRHVVVNGGVNVWKARWSAKLPYIEKAFGVKLPTYAQLVARQWSVSEPSPSPVIPDAEPAPVPIDPPPPPPEPTPVVPESIEVVAPKPPTPTPAPIVPAPAPTPVRPNGLMQLLNIMLTFVKVLVDVFNRASRRR